MFKNLNDLIIKNEKKNRKNFYNYRRIDLKDIKWDFIIIEELI